MGKGVNQVRVTKILGGGGAIGSMDPQVGMTTHMGPILSLDSGNYTVVVGMGSGSYQQRFYPADLFVAYPDATGWAWPTGVNDVQFGHTHGVLANGAPLAIGSGMYYLGGDGTVHSFHR